MSMGKFTELYKMEVNKLQCSTDDMEGPDGKDLSSLGVRAQSHDSYELDIMSKIAKKIEQKEREQKIIKNKKQIITITSELNILIER